MANEQRPNTKTPPDEDSVFSRLMNTRVAQTNRIPNGQVGAVVVFAPTVTIEDVNELLRDPKWRDLIESHNVQEFNPQYGSPVFYVP